MGIQASEAAKAAGPAARESRGSFRAAAAFLAAAFLAAAPALAGCGPSDAGAARDGLADLSAEIRELELDSLTAKVDPAKLNLARKMASPERSISDIHEKFERSLDAFEQWNREIEDETADLKRVIETMKRIDCGPCPSVAEAWRRFWAVTGEIDRVQGLEWRFR